MSREQSFFIDLINRFNYIDRIIRTAPYTLGGTTGSGGGSGGPPGGFIGQLPQGQVTGDTTESFLYTSGSIGSLVDNLNNIRAWLLPPHNFWAETVGTNQIYVSSGSWYYQNLTSPLIYTGGYAPPLTAPLSDNRYDLLYINSAGILDWIHGTESPSPSLPSFPDQTSGSLPLWLIYSRSTGSAIARYDDGTNHYIYGDYRPFLSSIGTSGSGSSGSSLYQWYADGPISTGSGIDGVYFTPSAVTVTGVDLFLGVPNSSGSTIVDVQYSSNGTTWASLFVSSSPPTLSPGQILGSFSTDAVTIPVSNVVRANITSAGDGGTSLSVNLRGTVVASSSGGSSLPTTSYHQAIFTLDDVIYTNTGAIRLRNLTGRTLNISQVFCEVGTAPTGNDIVVDINKNDVTIFTDQANRPRILAGSNSGYTTAVDISSWYANEYLTMDIDEIGSIIVGSNLVVTVVYQ